MSVTKAQLVGGVGLSTVGNLTVFGGVNATGVVTATSFYGGSATITGNVSIAGTLTYEDVTNVDSIGIVTARAGIVLGPTANTIRLGTGTTISSPASDTFTILTGGSERLRVSSAGGLGVGTTANPGAGAIYATGDITAFYSSDIRLKKDIEPISEPIKKLMEISGVTYKWNEEYLKDKDVDGYFVRETEVGVIAQEVEKVLPEVIATRENGYKAVRYEKLVALLIEAVKDQQHQIDELKARLEEK